MLDIETREHTNSKGETYSQYFMGNQMVGCGCRQALAIHIEKYNWQPCHHMKDHNGVLAITTTDVVQHIEDDLRNSCCLCGYPTKGVICFRCLN